MARVLETPEERLNKLGITLPDMAAPIANYLPFVEVGSFVFISGQIAILKGQMPFEGKIGENLDMAESRQATQIAILNVIAQIKAACGGDLARVKRCVRLGGFLNVAPGYSDLSIIMDHASEMLTAIFGKDIGQHARFVVGVNALPKNSPIEIEAIFKIA